MLKSKHRFHVAICCADYLPLTRQKNLSVFLLFL